MMPRVVLHKGVSEYLSLNTMVDGLAGAFARRGLAPAVLDLAAPDYPNRIRAVLTEGDLALFLGLNGMGMPREAGTFHDRLEVPFLGLFVDHPAYHPERLAAPIPNLRLAFPSRTNLDFCRRALGVGVPLLHLPHAAEPVVGLPWAERDIPVFYSGSPMAADPESLRGNWRNFGATAREAMEAVVAAHDKVPRRPLESVVAEVLGLPLAAFGRYRPVFLAVDAYLRSRIKVETLKALADAGIEVAVCGRGWEAVPGRRRLLGSLDAPATFALMGRSRLVLNLLPPYYESHERVFQAMAAGALAATTPSDLWDRLFPNGECLSLPCRPDGIAATVAEILDRPEEMAERAAAGRAAFLAGHTWDHRVDAILSFG
jgi:hypothetical protein